MNFIWEKIKRNFLGKPLATKQAIQERLTNAQGLAIFGADAMSSTAYATEEIILALAAASIFGSIVSVWIAAAIAALIIIIAVSYRQIIFAYPQGGGVYNVAKENLGSTAALIGGASLWVDYILTVAVSVAAGVAAITSAFPALYPERIAIGLIIIFGLMWANLRGVRESGRIFALPTYLFIVSFTVMIIYGLFRFIFGNFPVAESSQHAVAAGSIGMLSFVLIIRAFASGCTAMTGIEATSNGVRAFKPPESKNAAKTLMWLALILGSIFLGITLLSYWSKVVPIENETIISQIGRNLFGNSPFYYFIQGITAFILILAANTPFAGFPRIASMFAKDGYFPHQFYTLGSRLVFTNGIVMLAIAAALLIVLFGGSVHALIPLYAVGVFLGFALSQLGMLVYWKKTGKGNIKNVAINTVGFITTSAVFLIVFFAKFTSGAWVLIPSIILIVLLMQKIKKHYSNLRKTLALDTQGDGAAAHGKTIIVLISQLNRAVLHAVRFAESLRPVRLRAVHVALDEKISEEIAKKWSYYAPDVPLDIVPSEYRDLMEPLLLYLEQTEKRWPAESLIVVIPTLVCHHFWEHLLHDASAQHIRKEIEQDTRNHAQILEIPIKPGHLNHL